MASEAGHFEEKGGQVVMVSLVVRVPMSFIRGPGFTTT